MGQAYPSPWVPGAPVPQLPSLTCFRIPTPRPGQMTTMEAVESAESLAAVAYLLNLVLKR